MTTLARFLFPAPAERAPAAIFMWWEARRLTYNAIVGATGILSLGVLTLFSLMPPSRMEMLPFALVLIYGVMANVFYSLGPIVEYTLELIWPRKLLPTGPTLFRMGLTFSVGLTLLPIPIGVWDWVIRVAKWLL